MQAVTINGLAFRSCGWRARAPFAMSRMAQLNENLHRTGLTGRWTIPRAGGFRIRCRCSLHVPLARQPTSSHGFELVPPVHGLSHLSGAGRCHEMVQLPQVVDVQVCIGMRCLPHQNGGHPRRSSGDDVKRHRVPDVHSSFWAYVEHFGGHPHDSMIGLVVTHLGSDDHRVPRRPIATPSQSEQRCDEHRNPSGTRVSLFHSAATRARSPVLRLPLPARQIVRR
jgi:hypothetical protein